MSKPESLVSDATRHQRLELATAFLNTALIPALDKLSLAETLTKLQLEELEANFKQEYPVLGSDFTLDIVWAIAWSQVSYQQQTNQTVTEDFLKVKRAWEVLTESVKAGA